MSVHAPTTAVDVVLIAMPWTVTQAPSIQLGILKGLLDRAQISAATAHLYVAFFDTVAARLGGKRIAIDTYETFGEAFGEWTFAVPPVLAYSQERDAAYRAHAAARHSEAWIDLAFRVRDLVPQFLATCADQILDRRPKVVGFSTTFHQTMPSLVLAKLLKQRQPALHIVFGGANCEGPMGQGLHRLFPWIDVVVRGEAEHVVGDVFRELIDARPVTPKPGLCIRDRDRVHVVDENVIDERSPRSRSRELVPLRVVNGATGVTTAAQQPMPQPVAMAEVPLPVYDEYFERLQSSPLAAQMEKIWIPYESARGCWWALRRVCTFCAANAHNMSFRSRKPEAVLRDIVTLSQHYPTPKIWFVDNIMDERYLRELFPEMRDAGYRVPMFVETRAHVSKEKLRAMAAAGVIMIQLGLESLSTPILNSIEKGTSALQNIRVLKWCAEFGIQCFYNVIYGFPGEPPEEYERMADVVASLTHLQAPNTPVRLRLDRFSPYYHNPEHFGIEIAGPRPSRRFVYGLPDDALMEIEYFFTFRYKDNRDPESYVAVFKEACATWQRHWRTNFCQLSYEQVGDGLRIVDLRSNMPATVYELGALEAHIYLACDNGASVGTLLKQVAAAQGQQLTAQDVRSFLQALLTRRLVYEEAGQYLALAVCRSLAAPHTEARYEPPMAQETPRYVQLRMHTEALHA